MPVATINPEKTERVELKTLQGAYVVLRKMSYDAYLQRRDMTTQIKLAANKGNMDEEEFSGQLAMAGRKVAVFDFQECIVDHNLTDANEEPLDFSKPYTLKKLDPRVGQEIGDAIDKMNQLLEDAELGN